MILMPLLGIAKQRLADQLGSAATAGEGRQNMLCAYLAGALLIGLLGNALVGAWWLDPAVGLLIAAVAVREGLEAWRGEGCCVSSPLAASASPTTPARTTAASLPRSASLNASAARRTAPGTAASHRRSRRPRVGPINEKAPPRGAFATCAEEDSNLHPVIPDQALNLVTRLSYPSVACQIVRIVPARGRYGRIGRSGCCHGCCHGNPQSITPPSTRPADLGVTLL